MKPTFSLFRLPENVIVKVLNTLYLGQLFAFSLISTKTKNLVTSLGLRAESVYISISWNITLVVCTERFLIVINFHEDLNAQNEFLFADITLPVDAYLPFQDTTVQSPIPFNFIDWMNHIRTVFCFTKPQKLRFYRGSERFNIGSLKHAIGNVNAFHVSSELTDAYIKEVLKLFNAPSDMSLDRNPFDEAWEVQQFFIQNYKVFTFFDVYSLDDMLLVNSKRVNFYCPTTRIQFNQFLHHWIRGSNPRLQSMFLSIDITDYVSIEVLLKGIHYIDVAEEEELEICQKHNIVSDYMVQIRRKDGTTAVIAMSEREPILNVHFVVLY
ncbi:hypothetical protein CRE_06105 [Caenorhabditis remanei]|uniref:F-box domain-containing protein n=1 Tax=Caenorhabditis remanei TaxID=31234 RepID=E3NEC7_CAERE|nr:hypothetical protein CRE_06105 [Caenorhabditis remanei]